MKRKAITRKPRPRFFLLDSGLYSVDILLSVGTTEAQVIHQVESRRARPLTTEEREAFQFTGNGKSIHLPNDACILWLRSLSVSILAHETFHVATFILDRAGIKLTPDSDEALGINILGAPSQPRRGDEQGTRRHRESTPGGGTMHTGKRAEARRYDSAGVPPETTAKNQGFIWTGGAVLETLLLALTLYLPSATWSKATIFVCGSVIIWAVAVHESRKSKPLSDDQEPDVLLELSARRKAYDSIEPIGIVAFNDAQATARDIRVGPLSSGDYPAGFYGGDAITPAGPTFVNTRLQFEPIPHLVGKARQPIAASNPSFTAPELVLPNPHVDAGLWWFIDRARQRREYVQTAAVDTLEAAHDRIRLRTTPIDIPMSVTYGDAQERKWERLETLHYDPTALTARISHGARRELTAPKATERTQEPKRPSASIDFEFERGRAMLHVTNSGSGAEFYATLRIRGAVRGMWGTAPKGTLHARWVHTDTARTRIARGQTCTLILADLVRDTLPSLGFSQWHMCAIANGHPIDIEALYSYTPLADPPMRIEDVILEGEVIADPDLANGLQPFRVVLRATDAVSSGLS